MDLTINTLSDLAAQIGFTHCGPLRMDALVFRDEVRAMCNADRCEKFGRTWSCPPACGTKEQALRLFASYKEGILLQTTGQMSDDFDLDVIRQTERQHKRMFDTITRQARQIDRTCFPMSAGSCTRCRRCTYPDRPCRYPDRMYPSMEARGLLVADVCTRSGLAYNYGPQTITFTACILFNKEGSA